MGRYSMRIQVVFFFFTLNSISLLHLTYPKSYYSTPISVTDHTKVNHISLGTFPLISQFSLDQDGPIGLIYDWSQKPYIGIWMGCSHCKFHEFTYSYNESLLNLL